MKVVFRYDAGGNLLKELDALKEQGMTVVCCPEGPDEPFATEMKDADVLWHVIQRVSDEVLAAAPKLKLVQKMGIGVNTIDLDAAKARGIPVCNMPGSNARAVAEMALMLMLACLRRLPLMDGIGREGARPVDKNTFDGMGEIHGRTVGLVGYGDIPKLLAPILGFMGAKVIYTARSKKDVPYDYLSLDEVVEQSDILSLHIPLTDESENILNADRINRMKKGAILINTARGALVDEDALYDALKRGHLSGAGLDVFIEEPIPEDHPLLTIDTVIKAPHVAWITDETFARSIKIAVQNSKAALGDKHFVHRVV